MQLLTVSKVVSSSVWQDLLATCIIVMQWKWCLSDFLGTSVYLKKKRQVVFLW